MTLTSYLHKTRWALTGLPILVVGGCLLWGQFCRTQHVQSETFGDATVKRRWGKSIFLEIDRNRDGSVDFRSVPDPSEPFALPPSEYWRDDDFDGVFELHVVFGSESVRPVREFEFDKDADGVFEISFHGNAADDAYESWLQEEAERHAIGADGSPPMDAQ